MGIGRTLKRWFLGRDIPHSAVPPRSGPHFQEYRELEKYVEDQLATGLPSNWAYRRGEHPLAWHIEPQVRTDKVAGTVDYILEVSGDYRYFIFYYGNSDAGICIRFLSTAMVMTSEHLRRYPLAKAVNEVIERCQVNTWGLT